LPEIFLLSRKNKKATTRGKWSLYLPWKGLESLKKEHYRGFECYGADYPVWGGTFPKTSLALGEKGGLARGKSEAGDDPEGKHAKS
jgi:hypothetical protein